MDKRVGSAEEALDGLRDGMSLAVGGFGLCGIPSVLIEMVKRRGITDLEVISNNCGTDAAGLGQLLASRQVRRVIASYVGENGEFARQYLAGELEVELTPQGTLAERLRAGGCGIPAFYSPTGVGTLVAEGGLPWRYGPASSVLVASPAKEQRDFDGRSYVLERAITADFALVRAAVADRAGNLVFHAAARNFNPLCAMAGRCCVAEAEEIVEVGALAPEEVHLPGIFVQRLIAVPPGTEKLVERLVLAGE